MTTANDVVTILLEASLRAAAIVALTASGLWALRVRAGSVRHAAFAAALVAMLVLPFRPEWLPSIAVPMWPTSVVAMTPVADRQETEVGVRQQRKGTTVAVQASGTAPARSVEPVAVPAPPVGGPGALSWSSILVGLWLCGALVMLVRLVGGWRLSSRLVTAARRTEIGDDVRDSTLVAAPLTVGAWSPRIVLPVAWRSWPADELAVVLAHERAHIRRRDTLVQWMAQVNRAVYWFNPAAWWLERQLASAAEQACDDEIVVTSDRTVWYANLLVRTAAAVHRRGGRVAWQGLGMANGRSLRSRIDRVLEGIALRQPSRTTRLLASVACAGAIVVGVACQRQAPPLLPDPEVAQRLQVQAARTQRFNAARAMTLDQVAALEEAFSKNPDDLDAASRLLTFYNSSGQKAMGWNAMVAARRRVLLSVIERHPESELTWWPLPERLDPDGWARAKKLWDAHVQAPSTAPRVLSAAVHFFSISEKSAAEKLLLRLMAEDPAGPQPRVVGNTYYPGWTSQLGELYAWAMLGSDDSRLGNVVRSASLGEANGPFAAEARRKLEASEDPELLTAAGRVLWRSTNNRNDWTVGDQLIRLGFDPVALGRSYLERAIALGPDSDTAHRLTDMLRASDKHAAGWARWRAVTDGKGRVVDSKLAALPEAERFDLLAEAAAHAFTTGENARFYDNDQAERRRQLERARRFAEESLALAEKFKTVFGYGPAVYGAHIALGLAKLADGDRREAAAHLVASTSGFAVGDEPGTWAQSAGARLATYLIKEGERDSVAGHYERLSQFSGSQRQSLLDAARALREGRMPLSYQHFVTSR